MANPGFADAFFPAGFNRPTAVFISGTDRTLLKWFAFAALAPYEGRVFWTDVRLPGEILDRLDPIVLHMIPEDRIYVLSPRELQPDDSGARQAEAAAATMLQSDETTHSIEGLVEFLRMPSHAQQLISSAGSVDSPAILVTANSQRLATVYPIERTAPLMQAMLEAGTCQVALWAEAPTQHLAMFDIVLHLEGGGPAQWKSATIRCERGITAGPLASGAAVRLSDIPPIARILEKSVPASASGP